MSILNKRVLDKFKIWNTNFFVPESFLGKRVSVYNGKMFVSLLIRDDHLNKRIGDFVSCKRQGNKIHKKKVAKKK